MGSQKLTKRMKKVAEKEFLRRQKEVERQALLWQSLPWWKRLSLRVKWFFTGELRKGATV